MTKAYGRRFALQTGSAFGTLSGLISCAAVLQVVLLLLVGTFCGGLYSAAHQSYRFAAADTASPQFRPRRSPGCWPARVLRRRDRHRARDLHQGLLAGLICSPRRSSANRPAQSSPHRADARENSAAAGVALVADGRPLTAIIAQPKFIVAVVCGLASYTMMNMMMTSAPLAMIMCHHSVSDARARHSVARRWACMRRALSPAP